MSALLKNALNNMAIEGVSPSGKKFNGISLAAIDRVAVESRMSKRAVEIAALEQGIIPLRYQRNIGSLGIDGQLKMRCAAVAVIGAGGLGGILVEMLARLGVGKITVIDGQTFTEDNLNRQLLCAEKDVGRAKVEVARQRIMAVNSAVEAEAHQLYISRENMDQLLKRVSVIIDALDSIPARLLIEEAGRRLQIPLVHGAIAGFIGEFMTILPGDDGLTSIYGRQALAADKGIEVETGTPTVTPIMIAAFQAMETIKLITGRSVPARHCMTYLDLDQKEMSVIHLCPQAGH